MAISPVNTSSTTSGAKGGSQAVVEDRDSIFSSDSYFPKTYNMM